MMPTHLRSARFDLRLEDDFREIRRSDSSSPSQTSTRFTGSFRPAALRRAEPRATQSGDPWCWWLPRPTMILPTPGRSTMRPSSGGELHSDASNCLTSYMKYSASVVRGAGVERRGTLLACLRSESHRYVRTRPSGRGGPCTRALRIAAVFRRDRRQGNPLAQRLHRRPMLPGDLRESPPPDRTARSDRRGRRQREPRRRPCWREGSRGG